MVYGVWRHLHWGSSRPAPARCLEQRQGDTMDAIRGAELHPWPQEAADGERKRGNKVDDAHGATDNKGRRRGLSPDAGDGERCRWTSEGTAGLVGVSGGRGEGPRALGGGPPSHGRCVVEFVRRARLFSFLNKRSPTICRTYLHGYHT